MSKTNPGNFFENFTLGQVIKHAVPRTVSAGEVSLYTALYGMRFGVNSSDDMARSIGLPQAPLEDFLVFNMVFGKSVSDISLNAVANLGYAGGRFGVLVYPGDTLKTTSKIIGLRETNMGDSGIVYVRSMGVNQRNEMVLDYCRWVMVKKNNENAPTPDTVVPEIPGPVGAEDLVVPDGIDFADYDYDLAGQPYVWDDYEVGEKIDHTDGMTLEEADHMTATRLYQNTAKVHFNAFEQKDSRFGKRLIYGGVVISMARSLSFNGLANAFKVVAVNAGTHAAPAFAGDTIYAWTEVLDKTEIEGNSEVGALRLRTVAAKDHPCSDFPYKDDNGQYAEGVLLDLDYTVLMPRK